MTAVLRQQVVTGDGVAAREWPKESAETALLIRGYPNDQTVWDELGKRLNQDYRAVSDDVRGSGESGAPVQIEENQTCAKLVVQHASRSLQRRIIWLR